MLIGVAGLASVPTCDPAYRRTDCAYRKLSAVRNSFEREKVKAQNHQKFANSDGIRDSPYGHQWRLVA